MKNKNITKIERWLNKIGYTIKDHGCGCYYIYDDDGDITEWSIWGENDTRIQLDTKKTYQHSCSFYLSDLNIYSLKNPKGGVDCVGFRGKLSKNVFLQFYKQKRNE